MKEAKKRRLVAGKRRTLANHKRSKTTNQRPSRYLSGGSQKVSTDEDDNVDDVDDDDDDDNASDRFLFVRTSFHIE